MNQEVFKTSEFELIKDKVQQMDSQWKSIEERNALDVVYKAISEYHQPTRKYKGINFSCGSCVQTAVKVVRNMVLFVY